MKGLLMWRAQSVQGRPLIMLLLGCVILASCSSGQPNTSSGVAAGTTETEAAVDDGGEQEAATLRLAVSELLFEFIPWEETGSGKLVWDHIYDYLLYANPESGELEPGIATDWELNADTNEYTFSLRDDVTFHDGSRLTSADVRYSLESIMAEESLNPSATPLREIVRGIETPDDYTVLIAVNEPWFGFLQELSDIRSVPIVPQQYIEDNGIQEARARPVGSGPFEVAEWQAGQFVRLSAVDDHWRRAPGFSEVELRLVQEQATRVGLLVAGEADLVDIEPSQAAEVESVGDRSVYAIPETLALGLFLFGQYDGVGEEASDGPLANADVRRALNLAVNREELVEQVWGDDASIASQWPAMPGTPGYIEDLEPYEYDPDAAVELLSEAGYPDGFSVSFLDVEVSGTPGLTEAAQVVSSYWEEIGVETESFQSADTGRFVELGQARELAGVVANAARLDWGRDVLYSIQVHLGPDSLLGAAETSTLADLGSAAEAAVMAEEYDEVLRRATQHIYDEHLVVPLAFSSYLWGVNDATVDISTWEPFRRSYPSHLETLQPAG